MSMSFPFVLMHMTYLNLVVSHEIPRSLWAVGVVKAIYIYRQELPQILPIWEVNYAYASGAWTYLSSSSKELEQQQNRMKMKMEMNIRMRT